MESPLRVSRDQFNCDGQKIRTDHLTPGRVRIGHRFTDRLGIVGVILLRLHIGLHKLRQRSGAPCVPIGSTLETSSALRRSHPVLSDKVLLRQRTKTPRLVSAASATRPCLCSPLRELETSASQYPVQPSLSSSGTTSGTRLTIIPDGSIPLGQTHFGHYIWSEPVDRPALLLGGCGWRWRGDGLGRRRLLRHNALAKWDFANLD